MKGKQDICSRNLRANKDNGLEDFKVKIIDATDVNNPNEWESV